MQNFSNEVVVHKFDCLCISNVIKAGSPQIMKIAVWSNTVECQFVSVHLLIRRRKTVVRRSSLSFVKNKHCLIFQRTTAFANMVLHSFFFTFFCQSSDSTKSAQQQFNCDFTRWKNLVNDDIVFKRINGFCIIMWKWIKIL